MFFPIAVSVKYSEKQPFNSCTCLGYIFQWQTLEKRHYVLLCSPIFKNCFFPSLLVSYDSFTLCSCPSIALTFWSQWLCDCSLQSPINDHWFSGGYFSSRTTQKNPGSFPIPSVAFPMDCYFLSGPFYLYILTLKTNQEFPSWLRS